VALFENKDAQVKMEQRLRQAEKMEALGQIAGGIAHDFNNILAAIIGFTEITIFKVDNNPEIHPNLQRILISCERAKKLVNQIRWFSQNTEINLEELYLKPIIEKSLIQFKENLPEHISLKFQLEEEKNPIKGDKQLLFEMTEHLLSNAKDAIENQGEIYIDLSNIIKEEEVLGIEDSSPPGAYTLLSIRDSGSGIEEAQIKKIFEPFYSTKAVGQGSGLGLSVVHGIVKSLGGNILVRSTKKEGTQFDIYLPQMIGGNEL
jgi:signal transduction histidine kinase